MNSSVYVGLALTSHASNILGTATMTNVVVGAPTQAMQLGEAEVITDLSDSDLQIFPNPTNQNSVWIKTHGSVDKQSTVEVISITGQNLITKPYSQLPEHDGAVELDISHLNKGLYFVRVRGKGILNASFVKN